MSLVSARTGTVQKIAETIWTSFVVIPPSFHMRCVSLLHSLLANLQQVEIVVDSSLSISPIAFCSECQSFNLLKTPWGQSRTLLSAAPGWRSSRRRKTEEQRLGSFVSPNTVERDITTCLGVIAEVGMSERRHQLHKGCLAGNLRPNLCPGHSNSCEEVWWMYTHYTLILDMDESFVSN